MPVTFSVIIPYHNNSVTIDQTVASVISQASAETQILIVDDRSDAASKAAIKKIADAYSSVSILAAQGRGASAARNSGARAAHGEIIWFLDADDCLTPGAFDNVDAVFAKAPDIGVVFGRVRITPTPGRGGGVVTPIVKQVTLSNILGENCVCTASNIAVRRTAFADIGDFNEDFTHAEDQEWLLRAFFTPRWRLEATPHITLNYRTSIGGLSTDLTKMEAGWRRMIALHRARLARTGPRERREAKALFYRYLARRALRLGQSRLEALRYVIASLTAAPSLLFGDFRRTSATSLAALAVAVLGVRPFRRLTA